MTIDKERLRVLASDCISHPLSRGISDIEEAGEGISALLSENAALAAENERLRKDAERYQWLRSRLPGSLYRIAGVIYSEGGEGVDAAIDAAMADKGGAAS